MVLVPVDDSLAVKFWIIAWIQAHTLPRAVLPVIANASYTTDGVIGWISRAGVTGWPIEANVTLVASLSNEVLSASTDVLWLVLEVLVEFLLLNALMGMQDIVDSLAHSIAVTPLRAVVDDDRVSYFDGIHFDVPHDFLLFSHMLQIIRLMLDNNFSVVWRI